MNVLSITEASKDFGVRTLFDNLTLHLTENERLGLIGPNGAGKSTLMKIIAGEESLSTGKRYLHKNIKIACASQEDNLNNNETVIQSVLRNCGERKDLLVNYNKVSTLLGKDPNNKELLSKLSKISNLMDEFDTWNLELRIKEILQKLGIKDTNLFVGDLSGGYRKRVSLASSLVSYPDILLLDEPTNHLDTNSVEWLQDWLK